MFFAESQILILKCKRNEHHSHRPCGVWRIEYGTNEMAIEGREKNFSRSLNDGLGFIVDVITTLRCYAMHITFI